jgi:hypothetical protein
VSRYKSMLTSLKPLIDCELASQASFLCLSLACPGCTDQTGVISSTYTGKGEAVSWLSISSPVPVIYFAHVR